MTKTGTITFEVTTDGCNLKVELDLGGSQAHLYEPFMALADRVLSRNAAASEPEPPPQPGPAPPFDTGIKPAILKLLADAGGELGNAHGVTRSIADQIGVAAIPVGNVLSRMKGAGLVEAVTTPNNRTTRVALTDAGWAAAGIERPDPEPDLEPDLPATDPAVREQRMRDRAADSAYDTGLR